MVVEVGKMPDLILLITMILIGGLIGYLTNKVAVKMLFRPHQKVGIGFLSIQGVLPKRKKVLAVSVGKMVEEALLNSDDIYQALFSKANQEKFKVLLKTTLTTRIERMIPSMFRGFLVEDVETMVNRYIDKEGDQLMASIMKHIKETTQEDLNIHAIVEDKILALDLDAFEKMIKDLTKKELRHIEYIGLILGLMIGLFQFFFTRLL